MSEIIDEEMLDDDDLDTQANKFLLFNIGNEVYGIGIEYVTEIIELQRITEVPDMPAYVKGVINLRGKVIPVMDVRLRFGMKERVHDDRTCIINVNIDGTSVGFIVDTVAEVHDILEQDIEPPPQFKEDNGHHRYISGLGKVGDSVKILLDVNKILFEGELEKIKEKV
ncbi:MAG: purine-binding chemotaxis protein CheW [Spirochaetales bacterium]|nr:purine-binding chemotaxis protein CheW [Spirochaetales bacterium]